MAPAALLCGLRPSAEIRWLHRNTSAHFRWNEQPSLLGCSTLQATDWLRSCLCCCSIDLPGAAGEALPYLSVSCKFFQEVQRRERSLTLMACLAPAMFLSLSSETASWHRAILICRAATILGDCWHSPAGSQCCRSLSATQGVAVHLSGWWRVHDLGGFCLHGRYVSCASLLQRGARLSGPVQEYGSSCSPAQRPCCSTK